MADEKLYVQATNEFEQGMQDTALWTKAIALERGDEQQAKFKYIELRVTQLIHASKEANSSTESSVAKVTEPRMLNTRRLSGFICLAIGLFFIGTATFLSLGQASGNFGMVATIFAIFFIIAFCPLRDGYNELCGKGFAGAGTAVIGFLLLGAQIYQLHQWLNEKGLTLSQLHSVPYYPEMHLPHIFLIFIASYLIWFGWSGTVKK